ncbi:MAG: 1-(5-phosphoribosyl)-5-[(5-phosphoribosylamino)methylideneamino] imidazole-4-carboxamide isomerase [Actinomycetota bacterium]|nr:1-(5-phosphoribosyl)-5-[(5-phosphoribosylamino)methylideneamino] imidazole-4-carboxamide isomerase [Actinomycetota bacterium]
MQIIPAVDVLDGAVVRLRRGEYGDVTRYSTGPVESAIEWIRAGATLIHVVDLGAARSGEPTRTLWTAFAEADIPFQIGGGIRDSATATEALEAGASRVVVGTTAVNDFGELKSIVEAVGADRVVAALDVRANRARGSGWTDAGAPVEEVVSRLVDAGITTALVTAIERDGTLEGPNHALLESVHSIAPSLSLIASGGVGSLHDVAALVASPCDQVIIGRALYEQRFTLPEAIAIASDPFGHD